ncbi:MAG: response regulator [Actinomycetota bacterium]|nr:response regulator [Actinomycetota bacterium]
MDCQMPVLNGYKATAEIRDRERQTLDRHLPIVALTASAIKGDEERCLEAGMDAYVTEPVTVVGSGEVLGRLIQPATDVLDRETVDGSGSSEATRRPCWRSWPTPSSRARPSRSPR